MTDESTQPKRTTITAHDIATWIGIGAMAVAVVATFVRFETGTTGFIEHANDWHNNVATELRDLRRNEIKELAEELDGVAVQLTELRERQRVIERTLEITD